MQRSIIPLVYIWASGPKRQGSRADRKRKERRAVCKCREAERAISVSDSERLHRRGTGRKPLLVPDTNNAKEAL